MEEAAATNDIIPQPAPYTQVDVFAWATNMTQYKDQLKIDLFVFSKKNVLYRLKIAPELVKLLPELFVNPIVEYVLNGIEQGLQVRSFEEGEAEEKVLQRVMLPKVDKAVEVLNWLKTQETEIEQFIENEHDLKRMKGLIARVSHEGMERPCYLIKALPQSQVMKGGQAWLVRDSKIIPFDAEAAFRIPADNQLLVVSQDIFVFNQSKLKSLFGYDAKEHTVAEKKIAQLSALYNLSMEEGVTIEKLMKENRTIIKKLQTLEIRQDLKATAIIDHAEELGIDLMSDQTGAIIIMDAKDMIRFINLINDDYVESNLTGMRYEIKAKKELKPPADSVL